MLDPDLFEYHPAFITPGEADRLLEVLWRELAWEQKEIFLFGRKVMQPRLVAWYGEKKAVYKYSGLELTPLPWHPVLQELRKRLEDFTGCNYNSVLANAYRNGNDSMGWHSDNEPELGAKPVIASISLGADRAFRVRRAGNRQRVAGKSSAIVLGHGSLLVMKGASQALYQHALPKTRRKTELRINLTYRQIEN
jgi:alkylated DNA repair dioxygenase AlkB